MYVDMYYLCVTAGKPKKAGALITICLMLGPDFISDQFVVETSDHARLKVALAMNNYFIVCRRGSKGGGREREGRERERVCVCMCV